MSPQVQPPTLLPLAVPWAPRVPAEAEFTGQVDPAPSLTVPRKPEPAQRDLDEQPDWADPRPDLVGDRQRWWVVLQAAYRLDVTAFGMLYVLRQCGARLEIAGPPDWSLRPEGPLPSWQIVRGEELSEAEYQDYRQRYMVPHAALLRQLLSAPTAAGIAHQPAAQTPGKTPEKPRQNAALTGHQSELAQPTPPRKNGQNTDAQPALLEPATMVAGGDW